jgi:hypothetical protein
MQGGAGSDDQYLCINGVACHDSSAPLGHRSSALSSESMLGSSALFVLQSFSIDIDLVIA